MVPRCSWSLKVLESFGVTNERLTFVQVPLQLIEPTLLQSNLQMELLSTVRSSQFSPLTRGIMRLLHNIWRTSFNGTAKGRLSSNCQRKQGSECAHHGQKEEAMGDDSETVDGELTYGSTGGAMGFISRGHSSWRID